MITNHTCIYFKQDKLIYEDFAWPTVSFLYNCSCVPKTSLQGERFLFGLTVANSPALVHLTQLLF